MAIVNGNVIGNLSGKLGNLSARTVNGQTILAARPSSFNPSQDAASIEVRSKFAVTANFSKFVSTLSALSEIWKKVKEPGISTYNKIFKSNFAYSSSSRPTENNIITPDGFPLLIESAIVQSDNVTVNIPVLTDVTTFSEDEKNLSINALLCYHDPKSSDKAQFQLFTLSSEVSSYLFSSAFESNLAYSPQQEIIAAQYNHSILYFIVASKTEDGKVVQYSATYSKLS